VLKAQKEKLLEKIQQKIPPIIPYTKTTFKLIVNTNSSSPNLDSSLPKMF